jgi:N-acetylgalactosamine-N,N'-diacetylbacillosaminyl-diphospho-undecaprenol 4-alpha-N-acetylgalactosaminyltransferase
MNSIVQFVRAPGMRRNKLSVSDTNLTLKFVINSMEGGGAERALANLIHYLEQPLKGCDVELVLLDDRDIKQALPAWIKVKVLDGRGSFVRSTIQLIRYLSQHRPDVVVSYLARANCLNVFSAFLYGHRAVISERVQTSSHLSTSRARALFEWLTRACYPRADKVVAVSQGVADDLSQNFKVPTDRICVIGNPIDANALRAKARETPAHLLPERFILAVGRMVLNKNFPMLLEGYAKANPAEDLVILGDGPERKALDKLVHDLGLAGRVHMPGFVDNPYPIMAQAHCLVSCSNAEGFPNTIIEAMTLGTPVIATDCPSGPAEVLRGVAVMGRDVTKNARDGILIPTSSPDSLCEALTIMADQEIRKKYAALAQERSQTFGVDNVVHAYLDLIFAGQMAPTPQEGNSI